jgi:hypothetical protein
MLHNDKDKKNKSLYSTAQTQCLHSNLTLITHFNRGSVGPYL